MKTIQAYLVVMLNFLVLGLQAQTVTTRSNEFTVDYTRTDKLVNTVVPIINWMVPIPETSYIDVPRFDISAEVVANGNLKAVTVYIKESVESSARATLNVRIPETVNSIAIDRTINLFDGANVVVIEAETKEGLKTSSYRQIQVGTSALTDMSKLGRTDYALIFATDSYDNWSDLVNPIYDSRSIAEELQNRYKFKVEVIENAVQADILKKLREYAEKQYKPLDQLFVFFAGHGTYDQSLGEGFVVTKESMLADEGKISYLSHNRLRSILNNIPCEHIFLAMDVCFGGTFDETLASARGTDDDVYQEQSQVQFLTRKLSFKTRRYLTSGGKVYVSDGIPGKHSPFAKSFLEALQSQGGRDGVLTLQEIFSYVEKLKNPPKMGEFGDNAIGSDFLFVVK
ncbi:MAG: caspase domain-containing protein [Chryseotalea sp.]|jgi:hypothetical protein